MEKPTLQLRETEYFTIEHYRKMYSKLHNKFDMSFIPMENKPVREVVKQYIPTPQIIQRPIQQPVQQQESSFFFAYGSPLFVLGATAAHLLIKSLRKR